MNKIKHLYGKTARQVYLTLAVIASFFAGRRCQTGFIETIEAHLPFGKDEFPLITSDDIPRLAGTWVLTDDSMARLQTHMARYWSREGIVPTTGIQATSRQLLLSATTLTLPGHSSPMPIGIRDLGPGDSSDKAAGYIFSIPEGFPCGCAAELFGWTVLNEPTGVYGSVFSIAKEKHPKMKSILLIRSPEFPEWWKSSYKVFISENGKLMLTSTFRTSEDAGGPIVLKWRHTDYFTGTHQTPVSGGAGEQPQ